LYFKSCNKVILLKNIMANKNENAEKTYIETEVFDYDFNDVVIDIDFNIPFEFPDDKFDFSEMDFKYDLA